MAQRRRNITHISKAANLFLQSALSDFTPDEGDWVYHLFSLVVRMPNSTIWRFLELNHPAEGRGLVREIYKRIQKTEDEWKRADWSVRHWREKFPMIVCAGALLMKKNDGRGRV